MEQRALAAESTAREAATARAARRRTKQPGRRIAQLEGSEGGCETLASQAASTKAEPEEGVCGRRRREGGGNANVGSVRSGGGGSSTSRSDSNLDRVVPSFATHCTKGVKENAKPFPRVEHLSSPRGTAKAARITPQAVPSGSQRSTKTKRSHTTHGAAPEQPCRTSWNSEVPRDASDIAASAASLESSLASAEATAATLAAMSRLVSSDQPLSSGTSDEGRLFLMTSNSGVRYVGELFTE